MRATLFLLAALPFLFAAGPDTFHFAPIGDRTGEHIPGVYEQVWKSLAADKPTFVLTPGDTIEGLHDENAATEWQQVETILKPWSAAGFPPAAKLPPKCLPRASWVNISQIHTITIERAGRRVGELPSKGSSK